MEFKRKILWNLLMTTTIAIITFLCTFETTTPNDQNTSINVHKTSRCLTTHHEYIKNDVAYIFFTDIFIPSYATGCSVNEYQYSLKLPLQDSFLTRIKELNKSNHTNTIHLHSISIIIKDISSHLCRWLIYI